MARVVRIIVYEGDDEAVRQCLYNSLPQGVKELPGYTITLYNHSSDLPNFWGLHPDEVKSTIARGTQDEVPNA